MALIKSNNAPAALAAFSMKDIENQARAILLRARQQAEQLLAEAQEQGEQLKQEAKAIGSAEGKSEGLAQGLEDGRNSGHQQALNEHKSALTQVVNSLTAAAKELDASRRKLEADATAEVLRLAIAIARRVTKRCGECDPTVLSNNIGEVVKLVVHASDVRIAINPSQRDTLLQSLPQLKLAWPALEHVELIEDAAIAPGGCRILTKHGWIDADLDEQIDRIANELLLRQDVQTRMDTNGHE